MELGKRLKRLRIEKELTTAELSQKAKVSRATISGMENSKIGGSLKTHLKICQGLDISIKEFYLGTKVLEGEVFATEAELVEAGVQEAAELFTYDEKTTSVILTSSLKKKNMLPQLLVFLPEGKTHLEENPLGTEKFLFCIEGELEVRVAEKSYSLKKGGALYFKSSYPHFIKNIAQTEARCLCVTSPVAL